MDSSPATQAQNDDLLVIFAFLKWHISQLFRLWIATLRAMRSLAMTNFCVFCSIRKKGANFFVDCFEFATQILAMTNYFLKPNPQIFFKKFKPKPKFNPKQNLT